MAFDYIPLWDRYRELFEPLQVDEIGRLVLAMQDYKDGKPVDITGNERFVWPSIRRDIDSAKAAYEETCKRQSENGSKGGRPKKPTASDENPKNPVVFSETQKSKINNNDNININNISPNGESNTRARRFTPPTLAEVQSYVAERQSQVDPQGFIDFYESKGWLVGKTPMKDWKAACRNAEKWDRWNKPTIGKPKSPNNMVGMDFNADSDRIRKNNARLDQILREIEGDNYEEQINQKWGG